MQAIVTKYLPATDTKGSRIKASCGRGSITIPYPHELSGEAVHRYAVDALLAKFAEEDAKRVHETTPANHHWGLYVTGETERGYVHVPLGRHFTALQEAGVSTENLVLLPR